jgi:FMN phosphatase YigB (HAD superfamily)
MAVRAVVFDVGGVLELSADDYPFARGGHGKPDPRVYALSCSRLGVSPGEAVLLDDREPYVAGAREAGMRAVWFRGDNAAAVAEITGVLRGL